MVQAGIHEEGAPNVDHAMDPSSAIDLGSIPEGDSVIADFRPLVGAASSADSSADSLTAGPHADPGVDAIPAPIASGVQVVLCQHVSQILLVDSLWHLDLMLHQPCQVLYQVF
jgi:hypothetical protein